MRSLLLVLALVVGFSTACHPGPVVDTNPNRVGGTIAGIVTTADSTVAVPGRKVTAIEVASGSRFEACFPLGRRSPQSPLTLRARGSSLVTRTVRSLSGTTRR